MAQILRKAHVSTGSPRLLPEDVGRALGAPHVSDAEKSVVAAEALEASIQRRINDAVAAEVASLIETAQERARKEGFDKGFGEGYDAGFESGHAAGEAALTVAIGRFDDMTIELGRSCKTQVDEAATLAIQISYAAIARVLGEEFAQIETVKRQIQTLCASVDRATIVAIHVSPVDFGALQANVGQHAPAIEDFPEVSIIADPQVNLGGCMVKTTRGALDARLETQLTLLDQVITATRESQRASHAE